MTLEQGIQISKAAQSAGYGVQVKNGLVQFITWIDQPNGASDITPHTDWLTYDEAMQLLTEGTI